MSEALIQAIAAVANGLDAGAPVWFSWGVHQGMHGATWLLVRSDGEVLRDTLAAGSTEPRRERLGTASASQIQELAQALLDCSFHHLKPRSAPSPAGELTIEVGAGESRLRVQLPLTERNRTEVMEISRRFEALARVGQATTTQQGARPSPSDSVEVRLATGNWFLLVVGGFATCGLVPLILWLSWRDFPRRFDSNGITTRSGKRYAWSELALRRRVNAARPDQVLGYDLLAPNRKGIRLAPGALADGSRVCASILENHAKSAGTAST